MRYLVIEPIVSKQDPNWINSPKVIGSYSDWAQAKTRVAKAQPRRTPGDLTVAYRDWHVVVEEADGTRRLPARAEMLQDDDFWG